MKNSEENGFIQFLRYFLISYKMHGSLLCLFLTLIRFGQRFSY